MKATIYTDGGARGNPGPAGIGAVIKGASPAEVSEYIGETTNNVAEYKALVSGLTEALKLGYKEAEVFCDSELIVKQIKGEYKVKQPHLIPLWNECRNLLSIFSKASITHVRREYNKEADKLVNQAIDAHMK
ncbi:MAG: ribonuclease HI family protein [Candidatus Margulisiibacteriota bacterium]